MRLCDLQVAPRSREEMEAIAGLAARMGLRVIGVEAPEPEAARALAGVARRHGLEAYTRITIEARDWGEAQRLIASLHQRYDIVAVRPRTAEAARLAARDPRVALVQLPPGMARYMDKSQALMLREGGSVVEIRLLPLLRGGDPRAALRGVMIIARRAAAYGAAFTVSSGARTRWELWPPASARALLEALGVPAPLAKAALTAYCGQALLKALGGGR